MEGALAPWHVIVVAIVGVVLFGSQRLPDAARALGQSLRILRAETQGRERDEPSAPHSPQPLFDVHTGERLGPPATDEPQP